MSRPGARFALWGGKWTNPYITNGLVGMWDAEWNAGGGVHDPNASKWKDLSGQAYDLNVPSVLSWSSDSLVYPAEGSKDTNRIWVDNSFTQHKSIEVVAKFNNNESSILRVYNSNTMVFHWNFSFFWAGVNRGGGNLRAGQRHYASVCIDPDAYRVYRDKLAVAGASGVALQPVGETAYTIGYYPSANYAFNGELCAIRYYNRPLADAEVEANRALDIARFKLPIA